MEANNMTMFLKPLKPVLEDMESTEFEQLSVQFGKFYHLVCLSWVNSEYFRIPGRLVTFLRKVSNLVIIQLRNYLDPTEVLKGEMEEVYDRITLAIKILQSFKKQFEIYRKKLPDFFGKLENPQEPVYWEFSGTLVFGKRLLEDAMEFEKLDRVVIGGLLGEGLSAKVQEIFEEFGVVFKLLTILSSLGNRKHIKDQLEPFYTKILQDLDQEVCAVRKIVTAHEELAEKLAKAPDLHAGETSSPPHSRRSHSSVSPPPGEANEETSIHEDSATSNDPPPAVAAGAAAATADDDTTSSKHSETGVQPEPVTASSSFETSVETTSKYRPPPSLVDKNMPSVAGEIKWSAELQKRLSLVPYLLDHIYHPWDEDVFQAWRMSVDAACEENLQRPLLISDPQTGLFRVNFDRKLQAILREMKYLQFKDRSELPESACRLFSQKDILRNYVLNLDLLTQWYNYLHTKVSDQEADLISSEMKDIERKLMEAQSDLNWTNEDTWRYIESTRDVIKDLKARVVQGQENVEKISALMSTWNKIPLFERKEGKRETLLALDDREERASKRYSEINEAGERIIAILEENRQLFRAELDSDAWHTYVEEIDTIVRDGFINAIRCSLNYLLDETEDIPTLAALFEVQMDLVVPEIVFVPPLEFGSSTTFLDIQYSLLDSIYMQAAQIPRLAKTKNFETYVDELEENEMLVELRQTFFDRINEAVQKALACQASFDSYAYLWADDRGKFMRHFLTYGEMPNTEDEEAVAAEGEGTMRAAGEKQPSPPSLRQFKEQMDRFEAIYAEVEQMEGTMKFNNCLRVDARRFKHGVLNIVKRWSLMFKQHLIEHVTDSLKELAEFIQVTSKGLEDEVEPGDYEHLVSTMGFLGGMKERQAATDEMFEPLQQTIELLKTYQHQMPDEVHRQLEACCIRAILQELPEKWAHLKKQAAIVKQVVAPLQNEEVANIRRRGAAFDVAQHKAKEAFIKIPPFDYSCEEPYKHLDEQHLVLRAMELDLAALVKSAELFEVSLPDFRQLKQCRRNLRLLKVLWDYVFVVRSRIASWTRTPWLEIDVDQLDADCRNFAKDLRRLDKEVRAWGTYLGVEEAVKNMTTSLQAVKELQNPAIRDRHWAQLMVATGVKFSMSKETTLADLLALSLHRFEDEVRNLVDKAVKEMAMEKVLRELNNTWSQTVFEVEEHARTNLKLPKFSEELIEVLEDNQVQLQNMITSKYIDFFRDEVFSWQSKLMTADQVISIWSEVQRVWSYLEAIFVGSEDIKEQLPEDSERFGRIDEAFRAIISDVEGSRNVIETTSRAHLYERLEKIQSELTLCEKALAEYLETKRLAFPRFYFVSPTDLLDILANGNAPEVVMKHLTKLFDSIAVLQFRKKPDGKTNTKVALVMQAKDGEVVTLATPCDLEGNVESWLNKLLHEMRATMLHYLADSVSTYEEKPREQWLFEYPAQVSLAGSQIGWAAEVNLNFARLEEGYENALKDFNKKQVSQLNALIGLLLGDLTTQERQKVMTICTIDVHNRDVVAKLISQRVDSAMAFAWLSQLRHRWDEVHKDCFANICDAQFRYAHEYLGNTPRLVITPLTDRCYITLTQSLHLTMSGAPAGPAGTGKTETTKDLGRALGVMVYVFNCSEQMDYKSVGNIYKGLAQSGAWGCFDEFNRISVDVLSVVAVQVKCIQDAIRDKRSRFDFLGEEISLDPVVGIFITMNPGYAGRTELPENLKALFRPCAMVVPDFELICEIMLVAEGFQDARLLARKFITLYQLCKELLSKQDHYDWGLRAIKSVLVVAGALRRGDPKRPENQVLMRALRDFNIPKMVAEDMPVFMGLIGDLFPGLDVPRKRDLAFEKEVRQATLDLKLQPEDNFVLKTVQLEELLVVRHSVFILGNAGTGKSMVWRALHRTNANLKLKPVAVDLDPKAVSNDELFGAISSATREWKDGLFSVVMRDLANMVQSGPKWIVLDGDIDPMWIESLNTVMDDNKVLTLASNERIPLTPNMRLVFEISHLKTATPATVSRAGILYINPQDLGWMPFVSSWLTLRENRSEQANLLILFERYVPICLEALKSRFKKIIPIVEIAHVQMLCYLLDAHLTQTNTPADSPKELYELYFVFCAVWAFGGSLFQDQLVDHRLEFSKWWISEFKSVKFPSQGSVFDYFIDPESKKFEPWLKRVEEFTLDQDIPLQSALVPTAETTRLRYFLDLLVAARRPVMLVGTAGTGKSVVVRSKLEEMGEDFIVVNVPFNFYTNSEMLQRSLEKHLEKKAGRTFGPPGTKRIIYFIDDLNMPEVDKYFTVQPHALMRQHIDHSHWYDRTKLILKDIVNTQYLACMNPTAGSFTVDPRLQRHFCVFSLSFPATEALRTIYSSILSQHLAASAFPPAVQKMANSITDLALEFHARMSATFLPTAVKFHYIFNLRDLTNIFQGLLFSNPACLKTPTDIVRLWIHEAQRVYSDKMTEKSDNETFQKLLQEVVKKNFYDMEEAVLFRQPLLYCHFSQGIGEPLYMPVPDTASITKILTDALDNYNELNAAMNLVLFEDAIAHVLRINRILESPRGNALLVGIGGSGKQSLSRLAAFISSLEVFQITLRKGYGIADLKADLGLLYQKAGLKNVSTVFLITDAQIADEKFLVLVNDLLASGEVQDLFPDDEVENIISAMRGDVKASGLLDTRENCWSFFIDKVRRMLKVVLCFSPVGSTLRVRSRRFPALVNCTSIDWFHEWPVEALLSVSYRFISSVELLDPALYASVSKFMSFVHRSVNEVSQRYLLSERRYNYTTPKSFLEQIKLYESMLRKQHGSLESKMQRLENGLQKLESTSQQVDDLKAKLAAQEVELAEKNEDANKLLAIVGAETEKVSGEKANANAEEEKVAKIKIEVSRKQRECEQDLAKAEPALLAAQEALNTLNKNNLTEMKSFGSPPPAVVRVVSAVMCLLAPDGKVPKDRSWKAAKAGIMSRIDQFLDNLINYNKENIHENCLKAVSEYLGDPEFDPDLVRNKSLAAAGLCSWTINIVRFYEVYLVVKPKRDALDQANEELRLATEKLDAVRKKIADLEAKLQKLTDEFQAAADKKRKCQEEADTTFKTIELANRLVGGLVSENVRWSAQVEQFKNQAKDLPGNVLVTVAFLSYLGYFTKKYRNDLMYSHWMPYLTSLEPPIPISSDLDPLTLLVDDAVVASWNNEGLPNDRMSIENAAILTSAERWPLIVDPQLQSLKWVKTRYGDDLKTVRLGQKGYLDVIERTISVGGMLLFENIGEFIDPVLDPLLGRNTIKKGKAIRLGDKEIDYDPKFRLILHTKLANPHYKPEMQAQTTLINFTVTIDGLEDQLLANVVSKERPDLEKLKADLTHQQNEFKITLKALEDSLLARLSAAEGNFLGDYALVENLESNKRTAIEIEERVGKAKTTEGEINEARELYRPASERAALLYFILNDLSKINPIYQFSLKAFSIVFDTAMDRATPAEEVKERVANIIDSITYSVYIYVSRGLFEKDKLLFTSQMAFQILQAKKAVHPNELNFLLRFPVMPDVTSPVDFITNLGWGAIKALSALDEFKNLDSDIVGSAKRWKKLVESETPEKERLPQEWKNKSDLQALCIMRAIRPDRMLYALSDFVRKNLGSVFVEGSSLPFAHSFEESGPATPIFFILSPGVDPLKDVETLGKQLGFTIDNKKFHNISLGQGQETVAQAAMELAAKEGHWVVLQNIHLVAKWLPTLEKRLEEYGTTGHADYRVFISAEPASSPEYHIIPQGILENAIKITNEPPTGMQANLHKALKNFSQATLEMCSKENEFKTILFALCYFHAAICERRKFGPQGWNRSYPFNNGDLTISANVLYNYLEVNNIVPWEDLRYLFGEIMYGGHITDDWDRRLCKTYLEEYLAPEMLDGDHFLSPGFKTPTNTDMKGYHAYIDESLPAESPYLYGLHPNAEIEFLTMTSEKLFRTLLELMPKSAEQGEGAVSSRDEKIQSILEDIWEKLPEPFNTASLQERVPPEERTPYVIVAFQECERMNILLREISRSLKELGLGLKGELTITAEMETISNSLYLDIVPPSWVILAYPSLLPLGLWYADLLARIKELDAWTSDFQLPAAVWLGGLFNPQSFLTAIMQQMARKNEWPLDRMVLQVDVTKKSKEELVSPPRDGAYIHNLFLEGARWDVQTGLLAEANMKELAPAMPVVFIKAIPVDRRDVKNMYECPVYKTKTRGPTFVWVFNLKTKERPAKWILRGVAILLQV
ncbi:Dynein heavy chain 9, axonemal [Sparganum proliferum]